ncbi:MAG: Cna B-type domain-containing protein, partial [Oscillospiraceae bacterium]|nr:Cna B-type domain-containing protein [Oscillospiraceae bacterium]
DTHFTIDETGKVTSKDTTIREDGVLLVEDEQLSSVSAAVKKVWKDENNRDGLRPKSLQVELLADGVKTGTRVALSDLNNWTAMVKDLPAKSAGKEITYTWSEPAVEGYTLTGTAGEGILTTLTNTHEAEKTKVSVRKAWEGGKQHPDSVKVQLYADGKAVGETVTLSEANGWKHTWTELVKNKNQAGVISAVRYTVGETEIPEGYTARITGNADTGFVITNTAAKGKLVIEKAFSIQEPEPEPEPDDRTTDIEVVKIWDDFENRDGNRPESITVHLYAGGEEVKSGQLTAANGWRKTFGGLPKFVNGTPIRYSVKEDPVPWYIPEYNHFTITNRYQPETTSVAVRKIWNDEDNKLGTRPLSIVMTLNNGMSVILKEENGWMASISGLPVMVNGKPAEYTWKEQKVLGYELESVITEGSVTTFTNTLWKRPDKPTEGKKPKNAGDTWYIFEEYDTPLGVDVVINHVGDCFD